MRIPKKFKKFVGKAVVESGGMVFIVPPLTDTNMTTGPFQLIHSKHGIIALQCWTNLYLAEAICEFQS